MDNDKLTYCEHCFTEFEHEHDCPGCIAHFEREEKRMVWMRQVSRHYGDIMYGPRNQ